MSEFFQTCSYHFFFFPFFLNFFFLKNLLASILEKLALFGDRVEAFSIRSFLGPGLRKAKIWLQLYKQIDFLKVVAD